MIVVSTTVGEFAENAYLVVDPGTRHAVFIDPGAEGDRLVDVVRKSGATLDAIWLTHAHVDHVGGVAALRRAYDVPVLLHPADAPLYAAAGQVARMYGISFDPPPPVDGTLAEGQELRVGPARFEVLHVPGHAPGHVIFVGDEIILGGDLLFAGSIGRTDLPFCDPRAMEESLARVAGLPHQLAVYPGHGDQTTIGREVRTNPFLSGHARPVRSGVR